MSTPLCDRRHLIVDDGARLPLGAACRRPGPRIGDQDGDDERPVLHPSVLAAATQVGERHPERLHVRLLVRRPRSRRGRPPGARGRGSSGSPRWRCPGELYADVRRRPVPASSPASSSSSRFGASAGAPPPRSSSSPAGSSTNPQRAGCRYWRRHRTGSSSSTARMTTAPGCSSTTPVNGSRRDRPGAGRVRAQREREPRTGRGPRWTRPARARPGLPVRVSPWTRRYRCRIRCTHHCRTGEPRDRHCQPDPGRGRGARRADRRRPLRHRRRPARAARGRALARRPRRSSFGCREPGASTFVDCVGRGPSRRDPQRRRRSTCRPCRARPAAAPRSRRRQRARGHLGPDRHRVGRRGSCAPSTPQDKLVYVWTSFEPDGAQPGLGLLRPARPQGGARVPGQRPTEMDGRSATARPRWSRTTATTAAGCGSSRTRRRCRRTSWWSTPARSTSSARSAAATASASTAGSRCGRSSSGTPRSCSRLTEQGLAFFGERFAPAVPAGALRPGVRARTWAAPWRTGAASPGPTPCSTAASRPTPSGPGGATVLLHEMAHMWFGDLVTMRWWDDLWLNEAFASLAATWASAEATEFTDGLGDASSPVEQLEALPPDMGPASHPIRGRGAGRGRTRWPTSTRSPTSRARRCCASSWPTSARRRSSRGCAATSADHAWGNTRLDDLMSAVGGAADHDLSDWTTAWLDRAGTDTLSLVDDARCLAIQPATAGSRGRTRSRSAPTSPATAGCERVGMTPRRGRPGRRRTVPDLPAGRPAPLNDGDLTFAAVRTDEASLQVLLASAGGLPDPVDRALAVATAWDMLAKGELSSDEFLDLPARRARHRAERRASSSRSSPWPCAPPSSGPRPCSVPRPASPAGRGPLPRARTSPT